MKNIINEKPTDDFHGRMLEATRFVDSKDITEKTILDIGCGYGWSEVFLLSKSPKKITACELTENDLSTIKENIHDDRVEYKVASAIELPFPDNAYDTVVSWEVIEHIPQNTELDMFKNINRVLKDGGVFYLSTPYKGFWSTMFDPAWWLIGHRHYTENDMHNFATKTGFETEKIVVKGGIWSILAILNLYFSKWVLRRSAIFSQYISHKIDVEFSYVKKKGSVNLFVAFKKKNT